MGSPSSRRVRTSSSSRADTTFSPTQPSTASFESFTCVGRTRGAFPVFHRLTSSVKQTLYHRLLAFKQLAAQLAAKQNHHRLNPLGIELGLSAPVPTVDGEGNAAEHYYEHLLDLSEKLFDNDIDASTFEEQLRYMVGIRAYPLFTIDKLIGTAIKHVRSDSPQVIGA